MRRLTSTFIAASAALLLTAGAASTQIMNASRDTMVTVSAPVSLPGVTLPAGTYLFRLADSQVNRNIVQIFDKEKSKIFATILAIPAQRDEATDEAVVTFKEAPANMPPPIRYWYYAGEKSGQEFAYPKKQAVLIANASKEPVLAVETESTNIDDMKGASISHVKPETAEPAPAPEQQPQQAAPTPTPAEPQQAAPAPTPAPTPAEPQQAAPAPTPAPTPAEPPAAQPPARPEPQAPAPEPAPTAAPERPVGTSGQATSAPAPERLPKTASELPLVGLTGLLALAGAIGARTLRRALL